MNLKSRHNFVLLLIFSLSFFLRFYKLDSVPSGLLRDEASIGYNAYSVLTTDKDEYGKFLPLYFESFGDYKLPVTIYLTTVSIKLFGLTEFAVRFSSAFLGSLTVIILYFLVKNGLKRVQLSNSFYLPYISSILLAINPWHLFHSRGAYEVSIALFFFTFAAYCITKNTTSFKLFWLGLNSFIIAFYTYSLTRLLSPLLFLVFIYILRKEVRKIYKPSILLLMIWLIILMLPFLLTILNPGAVSAPLQALIVTSSNVKASLVDFRSYLLLTPFPLLGKLLFNRFILLPYEYLKNILTSLSPSFYFVLGSNQYGIGNVGQFYLIEFVPLLIGVLHLIKGLKRSSFFQIVLGWTLATLAVSSLTTNPLSATRMFFMIPPVIILISVGLIRIYNILTQAKFNAYLILVIIFISYIWSFIYYAVSYYIRAPVVLAKEWESKNKELVDYLTKVDAKMDYIIITKPEKSFYIYLLFYQKIPPQVVWESLERYPANTEGWRHPKKLGRYQFRAINWSQDMNTHNEALLISQGDEYPEYQVVTDEIMYPDKHTAVADGNNIITYPESRKAYRIWKIEGYLKKTQDNED